MFLCILGETPAGPAPVVISGLNKGCPPAPPSSKGSRGRHDACTRKTVARHRHRRYARYLKYCNNKSFCRTRTVAADASTTRKRNDNLLFKQLLSNNNNIRPISFRIVHAPLVPAIIPEKSPPKSLEHAFGDVRKESRLIILVRRHHTIVVVNDLRRPIVQSAFFRAFIETTLLLLLLSSSLSLLGTYYKNPKTIVSDGINIPSDMLSSYRKG